MAERTSSPEHETENKSAFFNLRRSLVSTFRNKVSQVKVRSLTELANLDTKIEKAAYITSSIESGPKEKRHYKRHHNCDGTLGGFVYEGARVGSDVLMEPKTVVDGNSMVLGLTTLRDFSYINGSSIIYNSVISGDSYVSRNSKISNSKIKNTQVTDLVEINHSDIADSLLVGNTKVSHQTLRGEHAHIVKNPLTEIFLIPTAVKSKGTAQKSEKSLDTAKQVAYRLVELLGDMRKDFNSESIHWINFYAEPATLESKITLKGFLLSEEPKGTSEHRIKIAEVVLENSKTNVLVFDKYFQEPIKNIIERSKETGALGTSEVVVKP